MDLTAKCSAPCFNQLYWYLIHTGDMCLFSFQYSSQTQRDSAQELVVLLCVLCLPKITNPLYIEQLRKMGPPTS